VGVGDDAAVLPVTDGRVVASTDLLVEGRHFRTDWSSAGDIGCKAAAQNLADIAAMGAVPLALLIGLAAPPGVTVEWALDLTSGLAQEAERAGAHVVGGDLSGAEQIMLGVTAIGTMAGRDPVTRSGARSGDVVAIAGRLGYSAAGLELLRAGLTRPAQAVAGHRRPRPPYDAGPQAAALGATSMIDISDGLLADLGHLAAASGQRIDIETARLAPAAPLRAAALALLAARAPGAGPPDPMAWVLSGGEDHALAATFPPGVRLPARWKRIGHVTRGQGVWVDGANYPGKQGWRHFA
jgi:thiamine-monophosphate kinase